MHLFGNSNRSPAYDRSCETVDYLGYMALSLLHLVFKSYTPDASARCPREDDTYHCYEEREATHFFVPASLFLATRPTRSAAGSLMPTNLGFIA